MSGSGLVNIGNTCFLNAAVQALVNSQPLNALLERNSEILSKIAPHGNLLKEFDILRKLIQSDSANRKAIIPKAFVQSCKQTALFEIGIEQQDLCEFTQFLIFQFELCSKNESCANYPPHPAEFIKELLERKEWTFFSALFNGITTTEICQILPGNMNGRSPLIKVSGLPRYELFSVLSLTLRQICPSQKINTLADSESLLELLEKYTDPECLRDENAWFNDKTNKYETAYRCFRFVHFPPILILSLNRFSEIQRDGSRTKKQNLVFFPLKFFVIREQGGNNFKFSLTKNGKEVIAEFDLRAVCNHQGENLNCGHYTAFVRHLKSNEWLYFDDDKVLTTNIIGSENNTDAEMKKLADYLVTPEAYCLFYEQNTYFNAI